ncbi:hypothetical protein [Photobacterium leiognathi]|uniref:hypothetical protein n=1 Tax=Photobacterium leiognathi TaxID=553611 RepID=UPI0027337973|nr:hypothetical protein [Photobacterium leiognathi]
MDINFRKKYIKFVKIFSVSFIIILPLIYYVSSFAFPYIFPGYMDLNIYFTLSVAVKLSVLGVSLLNVIYISDNNEMDLIKKLSLYLATVFIVLILFYFSIGLTVINIPIIISLSLIIISLLDKHESRKK